jgi:threonine dehydrogenase-like Zn-dependent dehydrogenase
VVGRIAVQASELLGAGSVVAGGRDETRLCRAPELVADAVVALGHPRDLTDALGDAAGGEVDVMVDLLWG